MAGRRVLDLVQALDLGLLVWCLIQTPVRQYFYLAEALVGRLANSGQQGLALLQTFLFQNAMRVNPGLHVGVKLGVSLWSRARQPAFPPHFLEAALWNRQLFTYVEGA